MKLLSLFAFATFLLFSQTPAPIAPNVRHALNTITAADLKGDLSFLASDTLQGRYTPSPGLDVAAEFIASVFREAGLQPGGDQDYFQIANMVDRRMPRMQSGITLQQGSETETIPPQFIAVAETASASNVEHAPVVVLKNEDMQSLNTENLSGKAVLLRPFRPNPNDIPGYMRHSALIRELTHKAALVINLTEANAPQTGRPLLIEADEAHERRAPILNVKSDELQKWIDHAGDNAEPRTISVDIPAPEDKNVVVKNVIGVLPGSDPALKNTYVMVTAHYDHIGTTETAGRSGVNRQPAGNDHIYNGANDDGSGTVSVVEIAKAMATIAPHPKRSLVFMTFFGEERGLLGSQFYGRHPRFPVAQTVADLNLEQVGRTDSTEGPQVNTASLTGYDYSDVTKYLQAAGRALDIKVYMDPKASDPYFTRSDNAALAQLGVPAETLTVAFDYPDYHGLGDEWQKIDYDNMARVDRMVALGLFNMANSPNPPQWNAANPKTLPFREAQQKLLGKDVGH